MKDATTRVIFSLLLLALTGVAYCTPYYDWDLVAYIGSAVALREHDSRAIQHQAYAAIQRELAEDDYIDIASGSDFRRDVAQNADHFRQQLRFYQIRPLYMWIIAALHAGGLGWVVATRVASAAAFLGIGVLLFAWMDRYATDAKAATATLLLLFTPPIFTSARTGSPDALAALVVLVGTFKLVERNQVLLGASLLLVSLPLRTDSLIFVVLVLLSCALASAASKTRVIAIAVSLVAVSVVLTINHTQQSYPWSVLLRNTESPIVNPAQAPRTISAGYYFNALHDMADEARENSVTVFPFIAVLSLLSWKTPMRLKRLVKVVLLSWLAHVVLFPHLEDRYFIAGAAIIGVAASAAVLSPNETERLQAVA